MSTKSSFKTGLLGMQGKLYSFALKLTADNDQARDLVQDTTLKALDSEDKYVDNINFKGWLYTIMRNIFINNYRKSARENVVIDQSQDLFHINLSQDSGIFTPEGAYAVNEISRLIAELPSEYSTPFSMFIAGYKYEEIAEKLNVPLGTIKSRIFQTRNKLKAMLKDYR